MTASTSRYWFTALAALLVLAAAVAPANARAEAKRPVLLELFTSQGCSSCPPADAVLGELAGRSDVLALGFHVDYWDDLGWVDPFASPQFTARQHGYARQRGFEVYTPQLVVDGAVALIGSRRGQAEAAISDAASHQRPGVPAAIRRDGRMVQLSIGKSVDASAVGDVWLISFDRQLATTIRSGENAGKRIVYPNVVRSIRKLADWSNTPLMLDEMLAADERGERLALVVQARSGAVWAVAATD
jgi:hypothetical protein